MANAKTSFVFFIGDDGVIVSHIIGGKVDRKIFFANAEPDSLVALTDLTQKDPGAPIYILLDSIDQSYQTQSFPPVAKMSVQKLVNKKLARDFASGDITASLPLGKEKEGRQDWKFLLISIVPSPSLMQWMDFILELDNQFEGIYLVPVESEIFIQKLNNNNDTSEEKPVWSMLVLHNKVSGFRQVITKNGRLTFTRLTQAGSGDNSPLVIAGNIEQECVSTIEYLKRLSYSPDEGLDITIIAAPEIVEAIDESKIGDHNNSSFLTPAQAAERLGFEEENYTDNHFGDVIFSSFFSNNRKKVLPLHSTLSKKISLMQKLLTAVKLAAVILCLTILLGTAYYAYLWFDSFSDSTPIETSIEQSAQKISEINKQAEILPDDIEEIRDSVSVYQSFAEQKFVPLNFVKKLSEATPGGILVRNISWSSSNNFADRGNKKADNVRVDVTVDITQTTQTSEARINYINDYIDGLRIKYPDFSITHAAVNGTLYERDRLTVDFTNKASRSLATAPISFTITFSTTPDEDGGR